jgi:multimeric flavodoxin WrbA
MNVLAISGSPRKGGNTETLLDAVLRGVGREHQVKLERISDLKIQPCIGCGGCGKTGECVIKDDMAGVYEEIIAARRIIFSSPIYFYGITAQAKALIDRCQTLWSRKYLLTKKGGWHEDPEKKGFFLSVAATKGGKVFDGAILTMKYAFDAMGATYADEYLVRGVDRLGEMMKREAEIKKAEDFGAMVVG